MYDFTKKKFLEQPIVRQHKKCAELLRNLYDRDMADPSVSLGWELYLSFLRWMNESIPHFVPTVKTIADCYHHHLKKGNIAKREHQLLPTIRRGDHMQGEEPWPIAIYLDELRSAHNVGSIIRTTEALALGSLYFSQSTPFSTHKQVKDTAMGTEQWVSCVKEFDLNALPRPIIALETAEEAISLYNFIFPSSFTLVVGNEEYGCSDETLSQSDYLVKIPLRGRKNSLNVANAFALAAGEISRQKSINDKDYYDQKN